MTATVLTTQPRLLGTQTDTNDKCILNSEYKIYGEEELSFNSFLKLMNLYSMRSNSSDTPTVMPTSGGYQQYLIRRQAESNDVGVLQPVKGRGSDSTTFHNLPDCLQLHIFSYLGSNDLCILSTVSTQWAVLASDDLLWKRRLMFDVQKWRTIGHSSNPDMYKECQSDLHNKEIYMRCCPEVNMIMKNKNLTIHSISSYIRSFLPKKIPKIAMFGPGMETNTSGIVRKLIEDKTDLFHITGMFPGKVRGLGSGFTIKVDKSTTFNFIPLYSNTKEQRENGPREQRLASSKFFQQKQNAEQDNENIDQIETFPITTDMKDLLRGLDGYIFSIEASLTEEAGIEGARSELFSMINDQWCDTSAPLTVLACTPTASTPRVSNIDLVRKLRLGTLNRPWQIHTTVVEEMRGMVPALEWLIERSQRS